MINNQSFKIKFITVFLDISNEKLAQLFMGNAIKELLPAFKDLLKKLKLLDPM